MFLYNGKVYTMHPETPIVSAIAISGERIQAVGSDQAIQSEFSGKLKAINLNGKVVLPGLCDAHIHLEQYALGLMKVDCETTSKEECLRRVGQKAKQSSPGDWVLGHGWNQNSWMSGFGNASDLDMIAPENPVYLTAKSLHAGWANSQALRIAKLTSDTVDPVDGRIGRDEAGRPDGVLYESAMKLIEDCLPKPGVDDVAAAIETAQRNLWEMGLTSVHDFDRQRCFAALQSLHTNGRLKLRVLKSIPLELLDEAIALGLRSGFGDDFLRIGSVKIFADGALGPHTAAMLEPYEEEALNRGMLFLGQDQLFEIGRKAALNGFPLAVHAIGDRANREVLNALERLGKDQVRIHDLQDYARLQQRIEHVQLLHPEDIGRLKQLNVTASMQPLHATSDMLMADAFWGKRAALAYALQSLNQRGAKLVFGSDAPVESPNPFWGIHAAVTRRRQDGSPGSDGWYPEQRLNLQQALQAYTSNPAELAGWGNCIGQIAPGYYADVIVLEQDPFNMEPQDLFRIQPLGTMLSGEWVFSVL